MTLSAILAAYLHIFCIPEASRFNKSFGFLNLNPVIVVYPYCRMSRLKLPHCQVCMLSMHLRCELKYTHVILKYTGIQTKYIWN